MYVKAVAMVTDERLRGVNVDDLTRVWMDVQQQRKRAQRQFARENAVKSREEAKKYHDLVVKRKKEAKKAREEQASKRRSQNSATKSGASGTTKK